MITSLLTSIFINYGLPIIGTVVTGFAVKVLHTVNKKYNLDIQDQTVTNAVSYAEQLAAKAIKNGGSMSSAQKKEAAVQYVTDALKNVDPAAVSKIIEAKVNQVFKGMDYAASAEGGR